VVEQLNIQISQAHAATYSDNLRHQLDKNANNNYLNNYIIVKST